MANYNIKINFVFALFSKIVLAIAPIIVTPIIFSALSPIEAGYYYFITQIVAVFALLDIGIANSLSRLIPRLRHNSDFAIQKILATSFWSLAALSGVGFTIFYFSVDLLLEGMDSLPSEEYDSYRLIAILAVGLGMLSLPMKIGYGHLVADHKLGTTQKLEILGSLIRIGIFLSFLIFDSGTLLLCVLATQGSFLFISLLTFLMSLDGVSLRSYHPKWICMESFKQIVSLSTASLGITLSVVVQYQGAIIAVTYLLGLEATALFSIAVLIFRSVTPFFQIFPALLNPIAAERSNLADDQYMRDFFGLGVAYTASLVGLVAIGANLMLPFLFSIWLRSSTYGQPEFNILSNCVVALLLGYAISRPSSFGRSIAFGKGRHFLAAVCELTSASLAVILVLLCLNSVSNLLVVSISIAISIGTRGMLLYPLILRPLLSISYLQILNMCFGHLVKVLLVWVALMTIITVGLDSANFANLSVITHVIGAAVWGWLCVHFVIRRSDRNNFLGVLTASLSKIINFRTLKK